VTAHSRQRSWGSTCLHAGYLVIHSGRGSPRRGGLLSGPRCLPHLVPNLLRYTVVLAGVFVIAHIRVRLAGFGLSYE
jgi:hypothetical protein